MAPKLGIIAGGGHLPLRLAEACRHQGRPFFVLALEEAADPQAFSAFPHARVRLGAVGEALTYLRHFEVREVVLAGSIQRPSVGSIMPDAVGAKLIARLGFRLFSGDDALLKGLVDFLEAEGFRVVGADDVLDGLIAPPGCLSLRVPDAQAQQDIQLGMKVAHALGALDVGQAVIVENGYVLGVEAAEGTDALILRCKELQREQSRAVLVKARKPGQEARADLPVIGPQTLRRLAECGMAGAAFEAGGALLLGREEMVAYADESGLFVVGVGAAR